MQALLRYANAAAVARGLTDAGYPVSGPTVSRWARGQNVTELAVRHVTDLLRQTAETAPPDWAERLLEGVFALERKGGISDDELAEAQARVAAFLVVARQRRQPREGAADGGVASA